jgi:hypothetical protein
MVEGPVVIEGYFSDTGGMSLMGVRPGFSQLVALAAASGADVVDLSLKGTLDPGFSSRQVPHRGGVRMLQYLDQVFEG